MDGQFVCDGALGWLALLWNIKSVSFAGLNTLLGVDQVKLPETFAVELSVANASDVQ